MSLCIFGSISGCSDNDTTSFEASSIERTKLSSEDSGRPTVNPEELTKRRADPVSGNLSTNSPNGSSSEESNTREPTQHVVKGVVTQWRPMVVFAKAGDEIVFRQMIGHDTQTIEGMIPSGATQWKSKLGEEGFAVKLSTPGIYMYKCAPHVSSGMIGAVVVGDVVSEDLRRLESHSLNKGMIGRAIRKLKMVLNAQTE